MFNRICFQPSGSPRARFDIGHLAEALIFYSKVIIVVNRGSIRDLVRQVHPLVLAEFIREGLVEIVYLDNQLGVITNNANSSNEVHDFGAFSIQKDDFSEIVYDAFAKSTNDKWNAKLAAQSFIRHATHLSLPPELSDFARSDLANGIDKARLKILVHDLCPGWEPKGDEFFSMEKVASGYKVATNLDFPALTPVYQEASGVTDSKLNAAYLLARMFDLQSDLFISATHQAELVTSNVNSVLVQEKFTALAVERQKSEKVIATFQDLTLESSTAIRETINSGKADFAELKQVVLRAAKFKEWLSKAPPDADILKDYYKQVTAGSWLDKLPTRLTRWSLFTGVGLFIDSLGAGGLGTASGLAVSSFDSFLLDNLAKGWRPDQFVQGELKKFTKK